MRLFACFSGLMGFERMSILRERERERERDRSSSSKFAN